LGTRFFNTLNQRLVLGGEEGLLLFRSVEKEPLVFDLFIRSLEGGGQFFVGDVTSLPFRMQPRRDLTMFGDVAIAFLWGRGEGGDVSGEGRCVDFLFPFDRYRESERPRFRFP
jgi:hypothetical protein